MAWSVRPDREKLLELRAKSNWTRKDFVARVEDLGLSISENTVFKVEKGSGTVSMNTIEIFSKVYGVPSGLAPSFDTNS